MLNNASSEGQSLTYKAVQIVKECIAGKVVDRAQQLLGAGTVGGL